MHPVQQYSNTRTGVVLGPSHALEASPHQSDRPVTRPHKGEMCVCVCFLFVPRVCSCALLLLLLLLLYFLNLFACLAVGWYINAAYAHAHYVHPPIDAHPYGHAYAGRCAMRATKRTNTAHAGRMTSSSSYNKKIHICIISGEKRRACARAGMQGELSIPILFKTR